MNDNSKYIEVPVLTVGEAARFIGVGKKVIYQLVAFIEKGVFTNRQIAQLRRVPWRDRNSNIDSRLCNTCVAPTPVNA